MADFICTDDVKWELFKHNELRCKYHPPVTRILRFVKADDLAIRHDISGYALRFRNHGDLYMITTQIKEINWFN